MNPEGLNTDAIKQFCSRLLLLAGLGLTGYVGLQYWSIYHQQNQLEEQWLQQTMAAHTAATKMSSSQASSAQPLIKVSIPKIDLEAIVVEGASRSQLAVGPGHIEDTAMPGEAGNAVITAHRDTFFRRIRELTVGDQIFVSRNGKTFRYRVTGKKIVKPDDISVLRPATQPQLTLITCYPTYYIGPAPERLVVFSTLAQEEPAEKHSGLQ